MDADVIVVGAGPVGLTLAAELRLGGVTPLVLERLAEPSGERRARGLGPLAAEALWRRGLGPRLAPYDAEGRADFVRDHGSDRGHFAWIHKIDPALQEEPDRHGVMIWQPHLERILGGYATGLGVEVRRRHQVTGVDQDETGVTVVVDTPEGPRRLRAGYLVGCDGGRSTVRKAAGFDFPGTGPTMVTRRARARISDPEKLPPSGRTANGVLIHGPGVVGTTEFTDLPQDRTGAVTAEELAASIRRVCGVDVTVTDVQDDGMLRFADTARQASSYRSGRALLAGDAAHVHSPNGGQGLNLGLLDAVNLGWKLASTVRGTAPDGLLDTYTDERHPVGAAVLHNTRAQSALLRPGPHTDALRDIVSELMDLPEVNRYFGRMMSGLGTRHAFRYPASHPLTGRPCPPLTLTVPADGGTREAALTEFTGDGRTVLLAPAAEPAVARAAADRPEAVRPVEVTGCGDDRLAAALIRPDGVVAWAAAPGEPADPAGLDTALRAWLGDPAR